MDDFRPIMPPLIRLLAGIITLIVIQSIVLGFPGITALIPYTTITIASMTIFMLGLIVSAIVVKFGTQLSSAIADTYKSYKAYVPLLAWMFQMAALLILYNVSKPVASGYFTSAPWGYPLIFLVVALAPTIKVVVKLVDAFEGRNTSKHLLTN